MTFYHYFRLFFSPHFRKIQQIHLPESWVILIFVELFWQKCLSYFGKKCLRHFETENIDNFGQNGWFFHIWRAFWKNFFDISINLGVKCILLRVFTQKLSLFLQKWSKICQDLPKPGVFSFKCLSYFQILELFCLQNPWVIFKMVKKSLV